MVDGTGANRKGWRRAGRLYFLLFWKNVLLAKRTPMRTFLDIFLPVFFSFVLLRMRHVTESDVYSNTTVFEPFRIDRLPPSQQLPVSYIGFTPVTLLAARVMREAAQRLGLRGTSIQAETSLTEDYFYPLKHKRFATKTRS